MKLEFKVYEVKETSFIYKLIMKNSSKNQFIVVGEEGEEFKTHEITEKGIKLINGSNIQEYSFNIPKSVLRLKQYNDVGYITCYMDIPNEFLTFNIIENIQRLNL